MKFQNPLTLVIREAAAMWRAERAPIARPPEGQTTAEREATIDQIAGTFRLTKLKERMRAVTAPPAVSADYLEHEELIDYLASRNYWGDKPCPRETDDEPTAWGAL
jgi:hypothetical protein